MERLLSKYTSLFDRLSADSERLDNGDIFVDNYCNEQKQLILDLNQTLSLFSGYRTEIEVVEYALNFFEPTVLSFNNLLDKLLLLIKKINYTLSFEVDSKEELLIL
jgi:hypothetical protein